MFRRFTGTDLDTANARTVGSRQLQALLAHHHELSSRSIAVGAGGLVDVAASAATGGWGSRRIPADLRLGRSTSPTLLGFMFDVPFTANARTLATRQSDAMQNVVGSVGDIPGLVAVSSGPFSMQVAGSGGYGAGDVIYRRAVFDLSRSARTSTETRGANVAYHPESTPDVRLTANARTLASRQAPQIQSHAHNLRYSNTAGAVGGNQSVLDGGGALTYSTLTTGGTETRPVNAAYHPECMHRLGVKPRVVGSVDRSVLRGGWNLSRSVKGDGSVVSRVRALRSQLCRRVAPRTNAQHATRHDFAWAIESAGRAGHVAYGVPLARSHCPCICSAADVRHGAWG